ncbi:MAG: hypothetical protein ABSG31_18600 [Tepidisphaeraceae bacterium]|jgi:hypothetical protein
MPSQTILPPKPHSARGRIGWFFARYFWVLVRNLIGWILIISALVLGGIFPGPLGTPIFLIGLALVTLPGKRRVTSRLLRGNPIDLTSRPIRVMSVAAALLLPALIIFVLLHRNSGWHAGPLALACLLAIGGSWLAVFWLPRGANLVIGFLPRIRRKVRPWLKKHGINLLPPRRMRRSRYSPTPPHNEEILQIDPHQMDRARGAWHAFRMWLRHLSCG